ncbi:MAG: DNA alkylation repair protein, partial [Gemmatimonadota bacterium]
MRRRDTPAAERRSGLHRAEGAGEPAPASAAAIVDELEALADPAHARRAARYFRTGPGEYGEGDRFLGLRVPQVRGVAKRHRDASLPTMLGLLRSPWHEARLLALVLMVEAYRRGDDAVRAALFDAYLANTRHVNGWDLVDVSAGTLVGAHLEGRSKRLLIRLARSESLWERRIAIIATSHEIRCGRFDETLRIAALLLDDPHDLIHKAAGWMLREVGKRDRAVEECF